MARTSYGDAVTRHMHRNASLYGAGTRSYGDTIGHPAHVSSGITDVVPKFNAPPLKEGAHGVIDKKNR